jgi:Tol biopolymer transport system component
MRKVWNSFRRVPAKHMMRRGAAKQKCRAITSAFLWRIAVAIIWITLHGMRAFAGQLLQLTTQFSPPNVYPAGGGGDAGLPITSPDGRYILFASLANNLALTTNNTPVPVLVPASMSVYLRDRASNTTTLVSVNLSGAAGGNGDSWPAGISTNGRYALFESTASDLVAGDTNNAPDVFVRDLVQGVTRLVSVNTNGVSGNAGSRGSVMTPDGHYVAFTSAASNLVAGDANGISDVFVRDLQGNVTTLVSLGATPTNASTLLSSSGPPAITPNGRFVAFFSTAINLIPGVTSAGEVYVRDMLLGTTTLASTNARTLASSVLGSTNVISCNVSISADGNFVAFESCTNAPEPTSAPGIILRYNQQTGLTDLVHTNAAVPLTGFENIHNLDMTPDGRFIAFVANINGNSGSSTAIYLWDAQAGTNSLVSACLDQTVPTGAFCDSPVVSSNGQYVAFVSTATNLTTNAAAGACCLYLRDMHAGTTYLVGESTNGMVPWVNQTIVPNLSADGQSIAFESIVPNFVPNRTNANYGVFVATPLTGAIEWISAPHPALPGGGPTISWPLDTGLTYELQFTDDLGSTNWHDVTGAVLIVGKHGYGTDLAPASDQRFYRTVGH